MLLNLAIVGWNWFDWKFLFFLQTMNGKEPLPYFNESWTLAIEEWFYLLLPFCLLLLLRLKPLTPIIPLVGIVVFCIVCRYILQGYFGFGWRDTYHITLLNLDRILMGVVAAYVHRTYGSIWKVMKWPGLILGLILLSESVPINGGPLRTVLIAPHHGLAAALLLPAAVSWQTPPRIIGMPITWIALISYSLYLSHIPMAHLLSRTGVVQLSNGWSFFNVTIWLTASLMLAGISYLLVERTGMKIAANMDDQVRGVPAAGFDALPASRAVLK